MKMRSQGAQATVPQVPVWTDVQGRVIRANFVRADASSITLEMNGQNFTFLWKCWTLNQCVRHLFLAKRRPVQLRKTLLLLLRQFPLHPLPTAQPAQPPIPSPKPTAPPPPVITKAPEPAAVKGPTSKGTDPNSPLDPTEASDLGKLGR